MLYFNILLYKPFSAIVKFKYLSNSLQAKVWRAFLPWKMKLFSKFKKIARKRKIVILGIIIVFILLLALYRSDNIVIKKPKQLAAQLATYVYTKTNIDIANSMFRFIDEINIFRVKKNLLDGTLPIYNLELSSRVLGQLDNVSKISVSNGYLDSEINQWKPAKLNVDGREYNVQIKLHGDSKLHWSDNLKSYKIKPKKKEFIDNMRNFNLILFEDRLLQPKITRIVANDFGLMDIRDDIVVLKINGVVQGLYYLQERLDYTFLEKNRCSNCEIIIITDNWIEDHPYDNTFSRAGGIYTNEDTTPFDYEISNIDLPESELNKGKVLYSIYRLYESVNNDNLQNLMTYFDTDQLSSFMALRMVLGAPQLIVGNDFIMAYSATNSKFYPIARNDLIRELQLTNGGFEHGLATTHFSETKSFIPLFYLFAQDDQLTYLRNKKVYQYISNTNITAEIDELIDKYLPYALSYKANQHNTLYMSGRLKDSKKIIQHNMDLIKGTFEYSKAYINVVERSNRIILEIIPDSIAEIKFNSLKMRLAKGYSGKLTLVYSDGKNASSTNLIAIKDNTGLIDLMEFVKDLYFSAGLDKDLFPEKRVYRLEFIFEDADTVSIENLDISMRNDITGKDIMDDDIYVQIADGNDYYEIPAYFSFDRFKKEYPQFKWAYDDGNGELTLLEGSYMLDKDLIIPKTNGLNVDAGVSILIAGNKSVLSYSPVEIMGTKEKPVVVKALDDDEPFGIFGILGEGSKKAKSVINWLDLSGGNEKWINGVYFSGQLSIYHMDVDMDNTLVHGSNSDDGLNIKYSNVLINNSKFYGSSADQVDLDFVTGVIKNSEFKGTGKGIGGDNLDLSGSKVLVKNNKFSDSIDKGVSIGEETQALLYKNVILNNHIGAEVKDLSKVYFIENTFEQSKVALNASQKKQLFGGGFSYNYQNQYISNEKDFAKDAQSKIYNMNFSNGSYPLLISYIDDDVIYFP